MSSATRSPDPGLTFFALGPLRVTRDGAEVPLGPSKHRLVLAALLLEANHVVTVDSLIDAVWDGHTAGRPEATIQVYISALRKSLARAAGDTSSAPISTWGSGYQLAVAPGCFDVWSLDEKRQAAEQAIAAGDPARASALLNEALSLWQGPALSDVPTTTFVETVRASLEERRLDTLERRVGADLARGRHHELVGELQQLTARFPTREGMWASLMLALYRSGRQAEALAVYGRLRENLDDELGISPNPELQQLHGEILRQSEALDWHETGGGSDTFDPMATVREASRPLASSRFLQTSAGVRTYVTHLPFVIGRAEGCDLVLDDERVSRRHAQLVESEEGLAVIDLGSTNGVTVDGRTTPWANLHVGSVIGVGGETLELGED